MGKEKHKKEKSKKHKKEKSRKRDRSSSASGSDSEEERARQKAEKKARKVEEYWNKQASKGQTKFVWGKKIERDLMMGKDVKEFTAAAVQRKHEERMGANAAVAVAAAGVHQAEIEKVQKRREEKQAEKERMEEELVRQQQRQQQQEKQEQRQQHNSGLRVVLMRDEVEALLQRQRLAAEAVEQEQKEEEFHLQQAQVRAARRLAQARAKPVDWLVCDLYGLQQDEEHEGHNDDADDSEEEREQLRRQVEGDEWTDSFRHGGGGRGGPREPRERPGGFARPRGVAAEPYQVMFGLQLDDLQELRDEIKGYHGHARLGWRDTGLPQGAAARQVLLRLQLQDGYELLGGELESHVTPLNAEYWGCLLTLADHELEALQLRGDADKAAGGNHYQQQMQMQQQRQYGGYGSGGYGGGRGYGGFGGGGYGAAAAAAAAAADVPPPRAIGAPLEGHGPGGVHSAVQREIETLLSGQTHNQLMSMEKDIQRQLAAGEGDPEYWEAVLPRLKIHAAKARLREIKAQTLEQQLAAQEEKLDVAAALGWLDDAEEEEDAAQRRLGDDGVAFPKGAAKVVAEGDVPLSEDEADAAAAAEGRPQQQQQQRPLHPDEELEQQQAAEAAEAAAAAEQQHSDDEPEHRRPEASSSAAVGAASRRGAAAVAESDGRHSPPPVDPSEVADGELEVVNEEEDARMLELLRAQVRIKEAEKFMSAADIAARQAAGTAGDRAYQNQLLDPRNRFRGTHPMMRQVAGGNVETGVASRLTLGRQEEQLDEQTRRFREQALKAMGIDEGDRNFGCEVPVEAQAYWWHNRYAPRKPKYFNRIHTGYEWNKYNQTHYDTENPPPKVVQGYKFNIFYPDLLDRSTPPTYRVEADPNGSRDTCILVFSAGPPYEDIAFRIVNKEWETTQRRGFKCTYDRGILHLYFNFKRARYRR
ncbi:cactus-binding C-terminus of cactin protein-domain-containing protein [Scenedesmus sp. NREL 46B-D3]|nr:cactus-binding C-terminus of cactin protein-domain-containing protein [Scenedesmus sp. NREL 46B-D3]